MLASSQQSAVGTEAPCPRYWRLLSDVLGHFGNRRHRRDMQREKGVLVFTVFHKVLEVALGISDRMPRIKRCYLFVTVILKMDAC